MGLKQIRGGKRWVNRVGTWAVAAVLALSAGTFLVQARSPSSTSVVLTGLPVQGQAVMAQIREGGPFRYDKDGTVFGNRERILPRQARGYYREYTVRTPGARNRGARRIVCGGQQPQTPDACFYTGDHYNSFQQIVE